jgi:hypothetical protein
METLLAFIWAVVQYVVGCASWVVWLIISLMEFVCWVVAIALIVHAFNCFIN